MKGSPIMKKIVTIAPSKCLNYAPKLKKMVLSKFCIKLFSKSFNNSAGVSVLLSVGMGLCSSVYTPLVYAGQIMVSPMALNIKNDGPGFADVTVYNTGKKTAYVKAQLYELKNPGTSKQVEIKESPEDPIGFGLVASPMKMIIPVNQSRKVRLLPLAKNLSSERVYMLNVTPVEGELKLVGSKDNKSIHAGIRITVAYAVRTVLLPKNPKVLINISSNSSLNSKNSSKQQIWLKNNGNVNVLLTQQQLCSKHIGDVNTWSGCKVAKNISKRLYPNVSWRSADIAKADTQKLRFKAYFGDKIIYVKGA